jgi:hypothetical protein
MSVATNLPLFRKETAMDAELRFALHEKLLKESPQALAEFNEHLAGVLTPNIGGRKWDDELRKRQAKYAKAYCNSQNHARNCALCAFVLELMCLPPLRKQRLSSKSSQLFFAPYCGEYFLNPSDRNPS